MTSPTDKPADSSPSDTLFDPEGFLRDISTWNTTLAEKIARDFDIALTENHWKTLSALRDFYQTYEKPPLNNRVFIKYVAQQLGPELGNSAVQTRLFVPNGQASPVKVACKIAGLPKPPNCI